MNENEVLELAEQQLSITKDVFHCITKYLKQSTDIKEPVYINELVYEYSKYDDEESLVRFGIFIKHWELIEKMCKEQREELNRG